MAPGPAPAPKPGGAATGAADEWAAPTTGAGAAPTPLCGNACGDAATPPSPQDSPSEYTETSSAPATSARTSVRQIRSPEKSTTPRSLFTTGLTPSSTPKACSLYRAETGTSAPL